MKRSLLIALFVCFCCSLTFSQNSFYDTKEIITILKSDTLNDKTIESVNKLFAYFINGDTIDYQKYTKLVPQKLRDKIVNLMHKNYSSTKVCEYAKKLTTNNNFKRNHYSLWDKIKNLSDNCDNSNKYSDTIKLIHRDSAFLETLLRNLDSTKLSLRKYALETQLALDTHPDTLRFRTDTINLIQRQLDSIPDLKTRIWRNNITVKRLTDTINFLSRQAVDLFKNLPSTDSLTLLTYNFKEVQLSIAGLSNTVKAVQEIYLNQPQILNTIQQISIPNETASLTNFRIPTQTEMIDALAIYMARRFKQEVALTLFNELVKVLNKKELLGELFPATIRLFNNNNEFEIPRFGSMWNHAISEDLVNLPNNIKNSEYLKNKVFGNRPTEHYLLFRDMVTISEMVIKKNSLPEIVSLYKSDTSMLESNQLKQCAEVMYLINTELNDTTSSKYWINWNELAKMNLEEFEILLSLWESKYEPLFNLLAIKKPSTWITAERKTKAETIKNYFTKLLVTFNNLQNTQKQYLDRLQKDPNAPYTGMSFWDFQKNLFTQLLNEKIITVPGKVDSLIRFVNHSLAIYKLLEEKKYAPMIHEAVNILELFAPEKASRINELLVKDWKLERRKFKTIAEDFSQKIATINAAFMSDIERLKKYSGSDLSAEIKCTNTYKTYESLVKDTEVLLFFNRLKSKSLLAIKDIDMFEKFMIKAVTDKATTLHLDIKKNSPSAYKYLITTAEFLTDAMSSGNSKQLANVIEAYAMPPNSYKIKRKSRFSVDLNAYIGAYAGLELIKEKSTVKNDTITAPGFVYGLSAPVGFSLSWGHRKNSQGGSNSFLTRKGKFKESTNNAFTVTLSIIDIAAVVTYRVAKGENEALPKDLKWSQLLSPGIHIREGIRNTPLNFSAGVQFTPQLRNLNATGLEQKAWRFYTGIFFDLPLYNIYHR